MSDPTVNDLVARLEALETALAALRDRTSSAAEGMTDADAGSPHSPVEAARPGRRDLLRYGSLALGAAAVGLAPRPAEAANGGPVLIAATNTGTGQTILSSSGGGGAAFQGSATSGVGTTAGLVGETFSAGAESVGVGGLAGNTSSGLRAGVFGQSQSPDGAGVFGEGGSPTGLNFGVWGETASPGGYAMFGRNVNGHGIVGVTGATGGAAVIGLNNGVSGAYAGIFVGPVVITGSSTVLGTKSAAVKHPDGSHRLLYCVESPECWFEDFGKGQLHRGSADITFDPDFAAVADMNDYHVFVTPYDEHAELMVGGRTDCGFRITAKNDSSSAQFSWRVVARRNDVSAERLAQVSIPVAPPSPPEGAWKSWAVKNRSNPPRTKA